MVPGSLVLRKSYFHSKITLEMLHDSEENFKLRQIVSVPLIGLKASQNVVMTKPTRNSAILRSHLLLFIEIRSRPLDDVKSEETNILNLRGFRTPVALLTDYGFV